LAGDVYYGDGRSGGRLLSAQAVIEKKWHATPALEQQWLSCGTWTVLAEDRDLWKEVVNTYIDGKYGSA